MAFGHGKSSRIYANGYNLSSFLKGFKLPQNVDVVESAVFNSSAKDYLAGHEEAKLSVDGLFAGATGSDIDPLLQAKLGSTANIWSLWPQGDAVSAVGYGLRTIENRYEIASPVDGVVSVNAEGQAYLGADRMLSLKPLAAVSSSGSGSSVDGSAASNNGGVGYLQVTNISGSITAVIQHSSAGASWANLISFTKSTAIGAQRVATTATVKRYTKGSWSSTGAESATLQIGFRRK